MLITNQKCKVWRYKGANIKSQPVFDNAKLEDCNVIHARQEQLATSVRADSSGSQGRATTRRASFRMQFKAYSDINFGSKVQLPSIPNQTFKVVEVHPRFDAVGRLHHLQIDLEII